MMVGVISTYCFAQCTSISYSQQSTEDEKVNNRDLAHGVENRTEN